MVGPARTAVAGGLLLLGGALSALLLLEHHGKSLGKAAVATVCGEGEDSGCAQVARSPYAKLAGVPLAAVGLAFYLSLSLLILLAAVAGAELGAPAAVVVLGAAALALAIDLALLALQAFVIHAFCKMCLATYLVNAGVVAALWPARRAWKSLAASLSAPFARALGTAWLGATAALVVGVLGADAALYASEHLATASLLGAPLAPPAPDEAKACCGEAKRLQAILNDPAKLQQYLDEKAARDFETAVPEKVDLAGVPFKGPQNAPIQVVEYSDFMCPFCRNLATAFASYLPQSGNRVVIYFKSYPLDMSCNDELKTTVHDGACWLALGGVCANAEGKFWEYHDKVFSEARAKITREDTLKLAAELGLSKQFEGCLGAPATRERLLTDIKEGQRIGVKATPTVLINGKKLPSINDFLIDVEKESTRLGLPPLASTH